MFGTDGFGANLTKQVNFDTRVNGYEVIMLCNHSRVVDIAYGIHFESRVVVHEVVHFLGTPSQSCNSFTNVDRFFHVGYCAAFQQVNHTVCEHFCVQTQIFFVFQQNTNSVGDTADTQLQSCAVANFVSDHLTDFLIIIGQRRVVQNQQRSGGFAQSGYLRDVDQAVTHYAGHLIVYIQQDDVSFFTHCYNFCASHRAAEVTMLVHRRNFCVENIQSGLNISPVTGDSAVVTRNISMDTFLDAFSARSACEPGYIFILAFQFGFHEGTAFYGQCCVVYNTCQFASHCSCCNRFANSGRFFQTCGTCANVTGFYIHGNFFGGFAFCLIHFLEFVHILSPFFIYLIKNQHTANAFLLMHTIYVILFYILP